MKVWKASKRRTEPRVGRGVCAWSVRSLNDGLIVRGKLKRTARRVTCHVTAAIWWRK